MSEEGRRDAGFTLLEVLISTGVVMLLMSLAMSNLQQVTKAHRTIWNRAEMHSSVRSATELLQQEIGQAGRVALATPVTTTAGVTAGSATATVSSVSGLFTNEFLIVDAGSNQETVTITAIDAGSNQITIAAVSNDGSQSQASFSKAHANGATVLTGGSFQSGVIPDSGVVNGSDGYHLKLFGDINGDGNMVYVEYTCAPDAAGGYLYRNAMAWTTAPGSKPALSPDLVLLSNVVPNPASTSGGATLPCFTYQRDTTNQFVLDVAITLTVQTEKVDPVTLTHQTETKALLNVSPRNVMNAWQMHGAGYGFRVQSTPSSITALLP